MQLANREGFNYPTDLTLPYGTKEYCIFFIVEGFSLSIDVTKLHTVIQSLNVNDLVSSDFPWLREKTYDKGIWNLRQ